MMCEYDILADHGIPRRWFKDGVLDLLVWVEPDARFQLTYSERIHGGDHVRLEQRVVNFDSTHGLRHLVVGDDQNRFPTPKLLHEENEPVPSEWILGHLVKNQGAIPAEIFKHLARVLNKAVKA